MQGIAVGLSRQALSPMARSSCLCHDSASATFSKASFRCSAPKMWLCGQSMVKNICRWVQVG